MNGYDDIINLKRPISNKRITMPIENRAAQFAPFSALTGYDIAIKEAEKITDNKRLLCDGIKEIINEKLIYIKKNIEKIKDVTITYFVKYTNKKGGKYITLTCGVKKIDLDNLLIRMKNDYIISFENIYNIEGEIFDYLDV